MRSQHERDGRNAGRSADLGRQNGTDRPNSTWRYYRWPHHCVIRDRLLVWNSRKRNERLAVGLFIAGAVIVVVLVVVVASH